MIGILMNEIVRTLLHTRTSKHYIIAGKLAMSKYTVRGTMPNGGILEVPLSNVDAIEEYTEAQLDSFRIQLSSWSIVEGK